ncbi:hypothetical protein Golob_003873, partial [Gossypium lobatum]|nr:hypothetical protein [Gossypium lobatum]
EGGVLKRAGHTEAYVDLAVLAGLEPVAVLCEIVDDDGSMAGLPKLREFAQAEKLKIISTADLIRTVTNSFIAGYGGTSSSQLIFILPFVDYQSDPFSEVIYITIIDRYRRKRERLVELAAAALIPTMWGPFKAYCYRSLLDGIEHTAMVKVSISSEYSPPSSGEISDDQDILVRVHSECLTGYVFGSARCDCGNQGIGLGHKLRAYNLQDDGHDTVEANEELYLLILGNTGIGAQIRFLQPFVLVTYICYTDCFESYKTRFPSLARTVKSLNVVFNFLQILGDLGVHTMSLMTNNPAKYVGLKGYGLAISGRVPLLNPITKENKRYLETKQEKLGPIYGSDINATCNTAYQEV